MCGYCRSADREEGGGGVCKTAGLPEESSWTAQHRVVRPAAVLPSIPYSKQSLEHFVELVDLDRDGKLSFAEFHTAALTQNERLKRAFREVDHTGDARISAKDVERFAERLGWSLSHAEVKALMTVLDRSGRAFSPRWATVVTTRTRRACLRRG